MPKTKTKKPRHAGSATVRAAIDQLRKRIKAVSDERDKLWDLEATVKELGTSCSEAIESLNAAIDALSRYV